MSFILDNNTKSSFEKLEACILATIRQLFVEKQFCELNLNINSQENSCDDMNVEQVICTKAVRNKYNKHKSLPHSKKKSPAAIRKEIELQIMDRRDVSIKKITEQFLVEGLEIENRDGSYTSNDDIPASKNIHTDFLHSFDQNEHFNYNEK